MNDFENISDVTMGEEKILNNRYKLRNKIGEGSYGVVYKALDTKNKNNLVAIKQVSKARINCNPYLIEALKKELSIMRLVSEQNSVKLIEDFETKDHYNLVMELCDSDLDMELKKCFKANKRGFKELEIYAIMNQFNKIFLKMQKEHVIHRDLKLKNIMITYNENIDIIKFIIKLSDFGFSKVMNEDDVTGTNLGSPATKAPEIMIGKDYNSKADLWSIGVILYQLFFDRLPFPARNARELKEVIFSSDGVKLPKDINNPMSEICFNLIDSLLQKEPKKRIDFDKYFNHEFFSEKHKEELIKNTYKIKKIENNNEINPKMVNKEKEKENKNKKKDNKNDINKKNNENCLDFEKRFIKLLKIKDYNNEYNLYKAKDILYDKIVYIKEISRSIIDNNVRNKKIFEKEIQLLKTLKRKKFTEFIDLIETDSYYNIIIEYFSGNNLHNFINSRPYLSESLVILIFKQLKTSLIELNEKNIVLDFISPKNFAFTFYQNDTNFEIKFFDYGLSAIFYEEKYIKNYLLEEAELGSVNDSSINILNLGISVYKMLFGEEPLIKKNDDNEIKIKGKFKSEYKENLKNFLSRCIKKEKRYKWEEFFYDDFLNSNLVIPKSFDNLEKSLPLIKDEQIEKIIEIIIKKLNFIINYFDKILDDKEHFLDSEIYTKFYGDVITFLLFCKIECKTIKKFLEINTDVSVSKIDRTNQEIHLLKIYLNKNSKDNNKYNYSYINFLDENKNNINYLYNKENPTFELYSKVFYEIEKKIELICNKFIGNNTTNTIKSNGTNFERSTSHSDEIASPYNSVINTLNEKALSDDLKSEKDTKIPPQEGNLDKLFMNCFENGNKFYCSEEKEKAIDELNIAKYIAEYIIFLKLILGNKEIQIPFDKVIEENNYNQENNNNNITNENDYVIFATFIGGKIKLLKEKGILGYNNNDSTENLNDYDEPKIENIKIYDTIINFYPKIIQFIDEIKKEKNN